MTPEQRAFIRRSRRCGFDPTADGERNLAERYYAAIAEENPFALEAERLALPDQPHGRDATELRLAEEHSPERIHS